MANTKVPIELSSTPGIVDNSNATAITIDSAGNVGIGVTPKAWSVYNAIQIGEGALAGGEATAYGTSLSSNTYYDGSWKYLTTDEAAEYKMSNGVHSFRIAASGTADSAISWTTAATIDNSGRVLIGTDTGDAFTDDAVLRIGKSGDRAFLQFKTNGSDNSGILFGTETDDVRQQIIYEAGDDALTFRNNTNEAMRLTSAGNFGLGTSSPRTLINASSATGAILTLESSDTSLTTNDVIGGIDFYANDSSSNGTGAKVNIRAIATSTAGTATALTFGTSSSGSATAVEAFRVDASGNLLVGTTSTDTAAVGFRYRSSLDAISSVADGGISAYFGRRSSDGDIVVFRKDDATVGSIGTTGGRLVMYGSTSGTGAGWYFGANVLLPTNNTGATSDNGIDLGKFNIRFNDAYVTNGVTTGSDGNYKQDIEELNAAETAVAIACKGLLRKWRWIDAVEAKGADARIHFGIIAQDLQAAFEAEGLDAGRYAMFMSNTWWETQTEVEAVEAVEEVTDEEGNVTTEAVEAKDAYTRTDTFDTLADAPEGATERTRLGIRYSELLAFIIAAI